MKKSERLALIFSLIFSLSLVIFSWNVQKSQAIFTSYGALCAGSYCEYTVASMVGITSLSPDPAPVSTNVTGNARASFYVAWCHVEIDYGVRIVDFGQNYTAAGFPLDETHALGGKNEIIAVNSVDDSTGPYEGTCQAEGDATTGPHITTTDANVHTYELTYSINTSTYPAGSYTTLLEVDNDHYSGHEEPPECVSFPGEVPGHCPNWNDDSKSFTVGGAAPVLDDWISVNPHSIAHNGSATVQWGSAPGSGTTCVESEKQGNGSWINFDSSLFGTRNVGPLTGPQTWHYLIQCTNNSSSPTQKNYSVDLDVAGPNGLAASITTSPYTVTNGGSANINWVSSPVTGSSCKETHILPSGSVQNIGNSSTGSTTLSNLTVAGTHQVKISCDNSNTAPTHKEDVDSFSVTGVAGGGGLDGWLTVTPNTIANNGSATIQWGSAPASGTTCIEFEKQDSGNWSQFSSSLSGTRNVGPLSGPATWQYLIQCSNDTTTPTSVAATDSLTVNADAGGDGAPRGDLKCIGADGVSRDGTCYVDAGSAGQLTWTSTNSNSCHLTGLGLNEDVATSGSRETPDIDSFAAFSLTCSINGDFGPPDNASFDVTRSNLTSSDKDIVGVNGITNPATSACGGDLNHDQIDKTFGLIREGDIITFSINICNSGDVDSTITEVVDNLTNLTKPLKGWNAHYSDGTPLTGQDIRDSNGHTVGVKFNVSKVVHKKIGNTYGIGSITLNAQVHSWSTAGGLFRFQNKADIKQSSGVVQSVSTPFFLFSSNGGNPDLKEVAP